MSDVGQLLEDCEARGIGLSLASDGGLAVDAPEGSLTDDMVDRLKACKPQLLESLAPVADETADPFSDWIEWSEDGKTILAHPDFLDDRPADFGRPGPLPAEKISPPAPDDAPRCDRCGSVRFRDVEIHGGQSVRRDCAKCGTFIAFPVWYGATAESA